MVEPTGAHLGTVFFLHGSGGNATEIIRLINAIRGAWHQSLKFVVPEAYVIRQPRLLCEAPLARQPARFSSLQR